MRETVLCGKNGSVRLKGVEGGEGTVFYSGNLMKKEKRRDVTLETCKNGEREGSGLMTSSIQ